MAEKKGDKDQLQDIPDHEEESPKKKKLQEAPAEIIAKALHDMIMKDHEGI